MGRNSYDNGITVNKSTQITESVAAGGAFIIADVYPSIDGGQFPIKRIVGEPIEVWVDIYRDGHQVIATRTGQAHTIRHMLDNAAHKRDHRRQKIVGHDGQDTARVRGLSSIPLPTSRDRSPCGGFDWVNPRLTRTALSQQ